MFDANTSSGALMAQKERCSESVQDPRDAKLEYTVTIADDEDAGHHLARKPISKDNHVHRSQERLVLIDSQVVLGHSECVAPVGVRTGADPSRRWRRSTNLSHDCLEWFWHGGRRGSFWYQRTSTRAVVGAWNNVEAESRDQRPRLGTSERERHVVVALDGVWTACAFPGLPAVGTLYDSMKLEVHKKQSHLQMIKAKIEETKKRYELSMRERDMAKHAADEMSSRMKKIDLHARVLEEKLRIAEVELARVEWTQNSLLTTSKEVVAGALRIVKLVGITSCRNPSENAIPATRLWSPPLGFDGESSLSSEFESFEPSGIAALLQICQDRAGLMIGAIEGGRGDPDANYSVLADSPMKMRRGKTLRGDDKLLTKNGKQSKKQPHNSNSTVNTGKRDKGGFGRGSVPAISFPIPPLSSSLAAGNTTSGFEPPAPLHEENDDESAGDPVTRDAIKASSRSKVLHKKACSSGHGAHGSVSNHHAASASNTTAKD
ncbi:hypothetical protein FI667_g11033, partial [Globisporangium splendens]